MSLASESNFYAGLREIRGDEVRRIHCTEMGVHIYFKDDSRIIAWSPLLKGMKYEYANDVDDELKPWPTKETYGTS